MSNEQGNSNILVEITDPHEFHCFRLVLNPKGHAADCPIAADILASTSFVTPTPVCTCGAAGAGARIEIMFHARSLVDLIHKSSLALCDWQAQTSAYLIDKLKGGTA